MKRLLTLWLATVFCLLSAHSYADEPTTKTSFKVSGNCEMCKKRIEKAASVKGVKSAVWNQDNGIMTVTFTPSLISLSQIQQRIADAGHDTEKFPANETAYNKLHKCCKYERKKVNFD